jgi:hypothetical protein
MPLTPLQSGQLNPGSNIFFGSGCTTSLTFSGSGGIFIPYGTLESYKTGTSGDVRELLYSVLDKVNTGLTTMSANTSSNKLNTTSTISFLDSSSVRKSYGVNVDLNISGMVYDVKDET